ncbi:MAG: BrnT family toxin [Geothrix sp.]|nr:BrnT family toxin [Geothrix sp.]
MEVSFDPIKNAQNIELRGLSFERVAGFEFTSAWIVVDDREDYGETRYRAIGFLEERLHALGFIETQIGIRVISFRKANQREERLYEQANTTP